MTTCLHINSIIQLSTNELGVICLIIRDTSNAWTICGLGDSKSIEHTVINHLIHELFIYLTII